MYNYFSLKESAKRYNDYRPKVHDIFTKWISSAIGKRKFESAIDIVCGTGDSTLPLLKMAKNVIGIDI